ncbi:MAG: DEAD/DEAH box helicase, partial [Bacteroidetes bacterium]
MTYLQIRGGLVEAREAYDDRLLFKQHGFRFDGNRKSWQRSLESLTPEVLEFLARWIDLSVVRDMVTALKGLGEKGHKVIGYMLASSRYAAYRSLIQQLAPEAANPAPAASVEDEKAVLEAAAKAGVSLFPHQVAAAVKMLKAHRSGERAFLLADAPRVGKTYSILAFLKVANQPATVLCPASVVGMWNEQLGRWGVEGFAVSYDTFRSQYEKKYKSSVTGVLVLDEAHRVKNARAKITSIVATEAKNASFVIAATGTPFQNEPAELLTVLKTSQISDYKSVYIAAEWRQERYGRRLVWKSLSAMKAFREHLEASSWYLRRELKDVAALMPRLMRESLVISAEGLNKHLAMIDKELEALYHQYLAEDRQGMADKVANIRAGLFAVEDLGALFPIASTLRRLLASAKLAAIESVVEDALEQVEEGEGVLFFAHHAEVIEKLQKALGDVPFAVIDGSVDTQARKGIADAFQRGDLKALILSTRAAGEGLTLSRAALAIFVELDWNPAALTQAENRLMNINDARTKIARYIVAPHPLEQRMVELIN